MAWMKRAMGLREMEAPETILELTGCCLGWLVLRGEGPRLGQAERVRERVGIGWGCCEKEGDLGAPLGCWTQTCPLRFESVGILRNAKCLKFRSRPFFVCFEHRAWRKTPLKPKSFQPFNWPFRPPVQAGKHARRSANQIEAPSPAGTISAPPLGGRFPVRAPKILFSGLSPLDLPLSGVLGIHVHTFPGFPLFHGFSPVL